MAPSDTTRPPFFVIGSPRSGTTLLRLMLTSHPRLIVPPECGFVIWLHPTFGAWGKAQFGDPAKRRLFAEAVADSRKFETWDLSLDEVDSALAVRKPNNYADACDAVYRLYAKRAGKDAANWGDKNNFYLSHITSLSKIFSGARFLHIVRDGRDVACSYREVMSQSIESQFHPVLPTAMSDIARQWSNDIRGIRRQLDGLSPEDFIELRYEDLTTNPKLELERTCEFLGVPFCELMLDFHLENKVRHLEPAQTIGWKKRTLTPVSPLTVGRHKSLLSKRECDEFRAIADEELNHYGYASPPVRNDI